MNSSFYMPPRLAPHYQADKPLAYTIVGGNVALPDISGRISLSDLPDIRLGQFMVRLSLAKRGVGAALASLIPVVVLVRAQEQVRRIAAGRIVAGMKNVQAFRNVTVRKLIGHSMREAGAAANQECAIAHLVMPSGLPLPALGRGATVNLRPKAFFDCWLVAAWGMIRHIGNSFVVIGHAPGRYSGAGAFSCLNYTTIALGGMS